MLKLDHPSITIHRPQEFLKTFLESYFERGLGSLNKRDIEVLLIYLLVRDGCMGPDIDINKISRLLKLSQTKTRNLVYDVQLRYLQYSEVEAIKHFIELIENARFEITKERITFVVRDPLLRQYLEDWISHIHGFSDTSFNKELIKISPELLPEIFTYLAGIHSSEQVKLEELKSRLPKDVDQSLFSQLTVKGLFKMFVEKYMQHLVSDMSKTTLAKTVEILRLLFNLH